VDRLEAQLVDSLSEFAAIDSNIELSIGPIVARLLRDIDWQHQLQHDLEFAQRQVDHIRAALAQWTSELPTDSAIALAVSHPDGIPDELHELAQLLRQVGDSLDDGPSPPTPANESATVRSAASSLDDAAIKLAAGRGQQSELDEALHHAASAIASTSTGAHHAITAPPEEAHDG
jgi:hypothetical protein